MTYDFSAFKKRIGEIETWLQNEFRQLRTGQATPAILDHIKVDAYGSAMPIQQVASIATEDAKTIRVAPWDTTLAKAIEGAIRDSELGLSVVVDDKGLRVIFPDLTSERREQLTKVAKTKFEDARVSLRKEREATWADIQQKEKDGKMTEDEKFRAKDDMQKLIDEANKKLEENTKKKEKDITG